MMIILYIILGILALYIGCIIYFAYVLNRNTKETGYLKRNE